jgi:endonuclease YncB( thermonuclease family)
VELSELVAGTGLGQEVFRHRVSLVMTPRTTYARGMIRPVILLLIALSPATGCHADNTGKVVGVSDGDTLTVLEGRTQVKVRLHGIDAVRRVI